MNRRRRRHRATAAKPGDDEPKKDAASSLSGPDREQGDFDVRTKGTAIRRRRQPTSGSSEAVAVGLPPNETSPRGRSW
jgi:hypothetical protein